MSALEANIFVILRSHTHVTHFVFSTTSTVVERVDQVRINA